MQLTKFKHACFTVTKNDQTIVVDPGFFSTDFVTPTTVTAVIITHEHMDHLDTGYLQAIVDKNPNALVVAHDSIVAQLPQFKTKAVAAGDTISISDFSLTFYGGQHAIIHPTIPIIANLGVMIDKKVYYPGDSFVTPQEPVKVLALPACAPWMKISEAIDFLVTVAPTMAFPTHDALLSNEGKTIFNRLFTMFAEKSDIDYRADIKTLDL